jgi:hypothetical protein
MAEPFDKVITLERVSEDEHRLVLPDGWQQGRGAFGGLVLGVLMEAMGAREPDATRLARTFSGDICGPALPVASRVVSRVLRRGNNQTNVSATLEQGGAVVAHASCVLAASRRVAPLRALALDPPARVAYEAAKVMEMGPPAGPIFALNYEYRPTGAPPFVEGPEALVQGWLKERAPLSRVTAAAMIARLDAYWPAIYSVEKGRRPVATVSFLAELLRDPATLDPTQPLFYRSRAVAEAGGYFVEMRELWDEEGPVALNQQSFAMLG